MDKYYKGIEAIVREAEDMKNAGLSLMVVYDDLKNQMYGMRFVAMCDREIDPEQFQDLLDRSSDIIDEWRERAFA